MKKHTRIYSFALIILLLASAGACRRGTYTQAQAVAAGNAIRQLDRVRVAVSVKAPRNEYDLVLDTSSRAVKEMLPNLPDGPLRQKIVSALEAYEDAGWLWAKESDVAFKTPDLTPLWAKYDLARRISSPPPVPTPQAPDGVMPGPNNQALIDVKIAQQLIWATAEENLNQAKELLTKENRIF